MCLSPLASQPARQPGGGGAVTKAKGESQEPMSRVWSGQDSKTGREAPDEAGTGDACYLLEEKRVPLTVSGSSDEVGTVTTPTCWRRSQLQV